MKRTFRVPAKLQALGLVFAVAACRGGGSSSPTPATPSVLDGELDVSGELANVLTLAPGDGVRQSILSFRPPASGTLVWVLMRVDAGSCQISDIAVVTTLNVRSPQGALTRVVDLGLIQPETLAAESRVELQVTAVARGACANARVELGFKFFADHPPGEGSGPPPLDRSSPPSRRPDQPTRPPVCVRTLDEPLARAEVVFYGVPTRAEGCAEQFRWRVGQHLFRDPNGCLNGRPQVVPAAAGDDSTVKITQVDREATLNLAWLQVTGGGEDVREALARGGTVHVLPATETCPDVDGPVVFAESTWTTILFRGDPRAECLGDGALAEGLGPVAASDVVIRYSYGNATPWFWEARLKLPPGAVSRLQGAPGDADGTALRFRLYNRRTHGFITPWLPLALSDGFATVRVDEQSALARLLPYLKDMEIVLADGREARCRAVLAAPLYEWAQDPEYQQRFEDLSNPGRRPDEIPDPL